MKKLSINVSDEEYRSCVSGKVNGKDLANCDYEDIYDFSKSMLEAVAEGILENSTIEVGDRVIKTGSVFGEIYGIVTHKQNGICTVMFDDGHTVLVLEDGLHHTGSNYKDLLTKIFARIGQDEKGTVTSEARECALEVERENLNNGGPFAYEEWCTCGHCGYRQALFIPRNYCPKCGYKFTSIIRKGFAEGYTMGEEGDEDKILVKLLIRSLVPTEE